MMELPIAKCLKDYYKEHNAWFTDSEKATIFWNSDLTLTEKLTALREIYDTTADEELKAQIKHRLDLEAEEYEAFMLDDPDYVHIVYIDDAESSETVFASINLALEYGKKECEETFKIEKIILEEKIPPGTYDEDDEDGNDDDSKEWILLGAEASFKKDGTLIDNRIWNSRRTNFIIINSMEPEGFEDAYVPVLNPFEYGDIVRIIGDSRPAIMVTSRAYHEAYIERVSKSDIMSLNYDTNTLTIEFLYDDGVFSHGHPNILYLEKIEEWEDKHEWELLQALSELMKGDGWVETVFEKYEKNKYMKS